LAHMRFTDHVVSLKVRFALCMLLLLTLGAAASACGGGADKEAEYSALLCDLTAALVDFTAFDLECSVQDGEPSPDELAARRDRYSAVLADTRSTTPPPDFEEFHAVCIPLFGQVLDGMDLMVLAAEDNDTVQAFTGRILLTEASKAIAAFVEAE
jgi:hypothetical protein